MNFLGRKMKKLCYSLSLVLVFGFASGVKGDLLPLEEIVNLTTSSPFNGIGDGLDDAFDGSFVINNLNGLDFARQIDTFEDIRTYRVFDSFTNNTGSSIATTITYNTNLGSDGGEFVVTQGPTQTITFEDFSGDGSPVGEFDPVLAFTTGNNQFTIDNAVADVPSGSYIISYDVTVDVGETLGLLQFASLIKDDTDRSNDVFLATTQSNALFASPRFDGLSSSQIQTIANFNASAVPEPTAATILAVFGLVAASRRRRA